MQEEVFVPQRLLGVVGYPLGHSLSPLLHNWALQQCTLPWTYMAWEIAPGNLQTFMAAVRVLPVYGLSVTIPHKKEAMSWIDNLTEAAAQTQAVNTLFWHQEELWGDNTDCEGFAAPLRSLNPGPSSCLILGSGGAAQACITAARGLGMKEITVAARNEQKMRKLQDFFGVRILPWSERKNCAADLLVNATPLGMSGDYQQYSPLSGPALKQFFWVYDLIYNPLKTKLLLEAQDQGCQIISGLEMFIRQAQTQFKHWSGLKFNAEQAAELITEALTKQQFRPA